MSVPGLEEYELVRKGPQVPFKRFRRHIVIVFESHQAYWRIRIAPVSCVQVGELGRGTFGVTWLARERNSSKTVAIKAIERYA